MPATSAAPTRQTKTADPVLENFYNLKAATVRLGLATEDEDDKRGQDWLRRGVNRPQDGSKGPRFPVHRMANQLMFSDSDLAVIAELMHDKPHGHNKPRRPRSRRTARSSS
ncbi:hypothetical protein ABZT17_12270 [Streptomyces sp. NPDC005648]|uniref:hypothetical protein n=1 Tax=Streptomyces sp. NPDC005648 TaxID=3157044 RepID=UPI0033B6F6AC